MRPFLLVIISILMISFTFCKSSENNIHENLILDDSKHSFAILPTAKYLIFVPPQSPDNAANFLGRSKSNQIHAKQISLGTGPEEAWIEIKIYNQSKQEEWIFVSEYPWLDRIDLFDASKGNPVKLGSIGWKENDSPRQIKDRIHAMKVSIPTGKEYKLLVRIESWADKFLSFHLDTEKGFLERDKFPFTLFPAYLQIASLILLVCGVYWYRTKNKLVLFYSTLVVCITLYSAFTEGYAQYFLPKNEYNSKLMFSFAFLYIILLLHFIRKFLNLSEKLPLGENISKVLLVFNCIPLICVWIPEFPAFPLENGGKINLMSTTLLIIGSGLFLLRKGFRPALFSTSGIIISALCINIFELSGMYGIPANDFTRNAPYIGYISEYILFFLGITKIAAESKKSKRSFTNVRDTGRLKGIDIQEISDKLSELMVKERIFCDEDLGLERLSSMVGLSRHQLSEFLNSIYEQNFYTYITGIRIQEASKVLLEEPDRSIISISDSLGFSSRSTLYKEFKKKFGITPDEFRKKNLSKLS